MPLGWFLPGDMFVALRDLPPAERRGAMLALARVQSVARGMRVTAARTGDDAVSAADAVILNAGAEAIDAALAITRRELAPLEPWHAAS